MSSSTRCTIGHSWRRGQDHPIWVKEGLCSLVEDYDLVDSGARDAALRPLGRVIRPAPSWRTNIVKRIERGGLLRPIQEWISNPEDRFLGVRPLSNYSLARAMFLYLFERGALRTWWNVILPLSAPTLATLALFSVIGAWSELLWPLIVLETRGQFTLPVAMNDLMGQFSTNIRPAYAASVLALVPIVGVFIIAQRFLKGELFAGSVKG